MDELHVGRDTLETEGFSIPAEEQGSKESPYEPNIGDDLVAAIRNTHWITTRWASPVKAHIRVGDRVFSVDGDYEVGLVTGSSSASEEDDVALMKIKMLAARAKEEFEAET